MLFIFIHLRALRVLGGSAFLQRTHFNGKAPIVHLKSLISIGLTVIAVVFAVLTMLEMLGVRTDVGISEILIALLMAFVVHVWIRTVHCSK